MKPNQDEPREMLPPNTPKDEHPSHPRAVADDNVEKIPPGWRRGNGAHTEKDSRTSHDEQPAASDADSQESGRNWPWRLIQAGLAVLVLLAGLGLSWWLYQQKTRAGKPAQVAEAAAVEVTVARLQDRPTTVVGHGTVRARERITLSAQVGGEVLSVHPNLVEGGIIRGGSTVLAMEPTDYQLALREAETAEQRLEAQLEQIDSRRQQADARIAAAEVALARAQAQATVARREFEQLFPDEQPTPLTAGTPQLREAQAALDAAVAERNDVGSQREQIQQRIEQAQVRIEQAQVNLQRTRVDLPERENGRPLYYRVLSRTVGVGDLVQPGRTVARLYRLDTLEVPVPVHSDELAWFELPKVEPRQIDLNAIADPMQPQPKDFPVTDTGAEATIITRYAGRRRTWPGRVIRLAGEVDPRTRMIEVIVGVEDPGEVDQLRDLLPVDAFVEVVIEGRVAEASATLPARALRGENDGKVWVARDQKLHVQPIELVRRSGGQAIVRGLEDGTWVITTQLQTPADGMKIDVSNPPGEQNGNDSTQTVQALKQQVDHLQQQLRQLETQQSNGEDDG